MATARKWRCELGYSLTEIWRCCDSGIPRPTAKRSPRRAGAELEETQAETRKVGSGAGLPASHSGLEFSPGCRRRSDWPGTAKFRGSSWRHRRGSPARSAPLRRPGVLHRSRSRHGSAGPLFTVSFRWANAFPLNGSSRNCDPSQPPSPPLSPRHRPQ